MSNNRVRIVVANVKELVDQAVIELSSCKEIPGPQNIDLGARIDSIEVLSGEAENSSPCVLHAHFVEVAKLTLDQEEQQIFLQAFRDKGRVSRHEESPRIELLISEGYRALSIFMIYLFVDDKIFADH